MIIVCWYCKKDCTDYEFRNIGNDMKPVCTDCTGRKKVMNVLVEEHERRISLLNNEQSLLTSWTR
jgi:hypothetical protein